MEALIKEMFESGSTKAIADRLQELGHADAPIIACLDNPVEVLSFVAKDLERPQLIFELPISDSDKLKISFDCTAVDKSILFHLTCDFAEHVLPIFELWNQFDERPRHLLEMTRLWIDGCATYEELVTVRDELNTRSERRKKKVIPKIPKHALNSTLSAAQQDIYYTYSYAQVAAGPREIEWQIEKIRTTFISISGS